MFWLAAFSFLLPLTSDQALCTIPLKRAVTNSQGGGEAEQTRKTLPRTTMTTIVPPPTPSPFPGESLSSSERTTSIRRSAASFASSMLGSLDSIWAKTAFNQFFQDGWGDAAEYLENDQNLLRIIESEGTECFPDIADLNFDDGTQYGDTSRLASFASPAAQWLPEESKTGYVLVISPPEDVPIRGVLIQVAATAEEGFLMRQHCVANPLAAKGYVSYILESPFYGMRRPVGQTGPFIRTVARFFSQLPTMMIEVTKLVKFARMRFPDIPLGLSGTSFGGGVIVGALPSVLRELQALDEAQGREPTALAICSFLPPSHGRCLVDSAIAPMFNFKSLVKDEDGFRTLKEAKARLLEVLDERDTAKFFTLPLDGVPTRTAFTCIRGQDDRIVTHEHAGDTFDIARPFVSSARQETLPGGHVSIIAQTYRFLPNAILETFSRLEGVEARMISSSPSTSSLGELARLKGASNKTSGAGRRRRLAFLYKFFTSPIALGCRLKQRRASVQ